MISQNSQFAKNLVTSGFQINAIISYGRIRICALNLYTESMNSNGVDAVRPERSHIDRAPMDTMPFITLGLS